MNNLGLHFCCEPGMFRSVTEGCHCAQFGIWGNTMRYLALIGLVALAGCATAAQRQANNIHQGFQQASASGNACIAQMYSDPAYAHITAHIPRTGKATIAQMSDQAFIDPGDVVALSNFQSALSNCRQGPLQTISSVAPSVGSVMSQAFVKDDQAFVSFAQRQISWGTFIQAREQINQWQRTQVVAAGQQIDAELREENQQELAQRAQAAQAFSQAMYQVQQQQQQAAYQQQMNRPVNTTCNRFGNTVNCSSY